MLSKALAESALRAHTINEKPATTYSKGEDRCLPF